LLWLSLVTCKHAATLLLIQAARRFASSKVLSFKETEDGDSQFLRIAGGVVPLMGGMVVRIRTENSDPLEADTFNWARVSAVSDDGRAVEVDVEKDGASETEEVARARVVVPRSDLFAASALLERNGVYAHALRACRLFPCLVFFAAADTPVTQCRTTALLFLVHTCFDLQ